MASNACNQQYLQNVVGSVVEVLPPYKAVVEFLNQSCKQRALLKLEKLTVNKSINDGPDEKRCISEFVKVGTVVKFLCHAFDPSGDDRCGWFVADVHALNPVELTDPSMLSGNICVCPTMFNKKGIISKIDKRQGILTLTEDDYDSGHDVLFLASKLYIHGKRAKQSLDQYLDLNDKVYFDAVPIEPDEDGGCAWFATVAWTGNKPEMNYNSLPKESETSPYLAQIKMLVKNPKSQFIRGVGQIMQILNEEYGIALGAVNKKQTHWQSILFHRSHATLFKHSLAKADLRQVFKEGDKIRFIAASAPKGLSAQWVASHITIDVVGKALDLL